MDEEINLKKTWRISNHNEDRVPAKVYDQFEYSTALYTMQHDGNWPDNGVLFVIADKVNSADQQI